MWYVHVRTVRIGLVQLRCTYPQVAHQLLRKFETFYVSAHISLLLLPPAVVAYADNHTLSTRSLFDSLVLCYTAYLSGLLVSVVVYRIAPVHPLASHPGPIYYKISKLAWALLSSDGYGHYHLRKLHEKYGDVVRIGAFIHNSSCSRNDSRGAIIIGLRRFTPPRPQRTISP